MKKWYLLFVVVATLVGCKKSKVPGCVNSEIKSFDQSTDCHSAKVDEYTFQGKTVYVFDPGTCGADMMSNVIDSDCNQLGGLGGIMGNNKINGEDFSNAQFVKNIWKK